VGNSHQSPSENKFPPRTGQKTQYEALLGVSMVLRGSSRRQFEPFKESALNISGYFSNRPADWQIFL